MLFTVGLSWGIAAIGCSSQSEDGSGDSSIGGAGGAGDTESAGGAGGAENTESADGSARRPFELSDVVDVLQGVLDLLDDDDASKDSSPVTRTRAKKPETRCIPGTRACECTANHTCDEGMDCIENVCGRASRWGPWTEGAGWPESQGLVWGESGMGGAPPVNGVWE